MTDKLPLKNGENYTLDDCREHARTHRAYGWSPRPWDTGQMSRRRLIMMLSMNMDTRNE